MAHSFDRLEQAARRYWPTVQFRDIRKDELKGYLRTLTNPCVSIAITCSCWKGNILQQRGVKYPAAEEEAARTEELQRGQVLMKKDLCWKKKKSSQWLTGLGPAGLEILGIFIRRDARPEHALLSLAGAFSIPKPCHQGKSQDLVRLCFLSLMGQNYLQEHNYSKSWCLWLFHTGAGGSNSPALCN